MKNRQIISSLKGG